MTAALNRIIHASFRAAGIVEDDDKRAIYDRVAGERHLTAMSDAKKQAVIDELRRVGASPAKGRRSPKDTVSGKFANVVRAFWLSGYNLGVIHDPDDRAILTFVQGQTSLDHVQWMHKHEDATAVIEAIKAWVRREAKLPDLWRLRRSVIAEHYTNDPRAQVIYGQWEVLVRLGAQPTTDLFAWVDALNWQETGYALAFRDLDGPKLIDMQKRLGHLIRAAKKGGA